MNVSFETSDWEYFLYLNGFHIDTFGNNIASQKAPYWVDEISNLTALFIQIMLCLALKTNAIFSARPTYTRLFVVKCITQPKYKHLDHNQLNYSSFNGPWFHCDFMI